MSHRRARTVLAIIAVFVFVAMVVVAAAAVQAAPRRASARSAGPKQPRIFGDRVVYTHDGIDPGGDIWLNDIAAGSQAVLPWASGLSPDQFPAIHGAVIAWRQGTQVRSRFLGTAPFTVSGASAVVNAGIRVSGSRYAWVDARDAGKAGLVYTKLLGGSEAAVDSAGYAQSAPSLSGNLLVWEDWRAGTTADIYMKDFSGGAAQSLTPSTGSTDQRRPSVYGTRVVWDDARLGDANIRYFNKATMSVGTSTDLTPEVWTTLTQLMAGGAGGDTHAHVTTATATGLEVGDYVGIGVSPSIDYLQITAISPGQLDFSTAAQYNHVSASPVRTYGRQISPAVWGDVNGYTVVWQDSRKGNPTIVDPIWKVRGARYDSGGSLEDTFQVPGAANAVQTSPQVFGDRVVWENEAGGASIGIYELRPYAYDAGAGATETARVLARASFAGHDAFFRYGVGSTPGGVDVSGGWSGDVTGTQSPVWLIGSGSAPGSGEVTVPASSIALTPGQTYYVAAQAKEGGSYTETQTSDGFTVDTVAPPAPGAPSATEGLSKVTLGWGAVTDTGGSGIDAYEIWRREGANPSTKVGEVTQTAFTDDGTYGLASAPVNGTTYHYRVIARDGARNRTAGPEAQAAPETPPGPVTSFTATPGIGQAALSWTNPPDADYQVTRILRSTVTFATTATPGGNQTQVYEGTATAKSETGLLGGTKYYWTAYARDLAGNWSTAATASATPPDVTPPGRVLSFKATPGNEQAALSWTNPSDADYQVTRVLRSTTAFATNATATGNQTQVYEGTATAKTETALVNGTTYFWTAYARDRAGNWSAAATSSATPQLPAGAMTIVSSASRVLYGGATNLTVRLTAGSPSENPTVTLYRRTLVGSSETTVGTRLLSSTGVAAFAGVKPSENAYYVARWAGDSSHSSGEATSPLVRVVAKVSILARPVIGTRGRVTVFSGGVWPNHKGKWIYLQRYYAGRWRNVRATRLSSASTYRILWAPNVRGRLYMRAYFGDGDGRHLSGERRLWYRVR